jgi:mannose-6-phosphate isomerase-like protein (cupin superfamily)
VPAKQQSQEEQEKKIDLPPNIRLVTDAEIVYDNDNYTTRELTFPDSTGRTAWSITVTRLKPSSQTRGHSHPELVEFYQIQRGEGLVMMKNQAFFIKPPMCIMNEPESWIKFINTSGTDDLVYMTFLNGRYSRPDVQRKR